MKKQTSLQVFATIDEAIITGIEALNDDTVGNQKAFETLVKQYEEMEIDGLTDIAGYNMVKDSEKNLKKIVAAIRKRRKELTAPALKFQSALIEEENRLIGILEPIVDRISSVRQDFEDKAAAAAQKVFNDRCVELSKNGFNLVGTNYVCGIFILSPEVIKTQSDEDFQKYISEGQKELARLKAEQERKDAEALELKTMREELAKEREEMRKIREELAAERAEMAAQKAALETEYKKVEEPTPEPTPEVKPEPKIDAVVTNDGNIAGEKEPVKTKWSDDYILGFEAFRKIMLDKFADGVPRKRTEWVEMIETVQP